MPQTKFVEKIEIHILCPISFFLKIVPFRRYCGKMWWSQRGHKQNTMAYTLCMLDKEGYTRSKTRTRPRARATTRTNSSTLARTHTHTHTQTHTQRKVYNTDRVSPATRILERSSIWLYMYIACLVLLLTIIISSLICIIRVEISPKIYNYLWYELKFIGTTHCLWLLSHALVWWWLKNSQNRLPATDDIVVYDLCVLYIVVSGWLITRHISKK